MNPPRRIVTARHDPAKRERAREFRRNPTPAEALLGARLRRSQLDGPVHEAQREQDRLRDAALGERGLRVLRFSNEQVLTDVETVLDGIARKARG